MRKKALHNIIKPMNIGPQKMRRTLTVILFSITLLFLNVSLSMSAALIDAKRNGQIVYLLMDSPASIERYDFNTQSFLTTIQLLDTPVAFSVDNDGLFISYGRYVTRLTLDGASEVRLRNAASDILMLFTWQDHLFYYTEDYNRGYVYSINKTTGELTDQKDYSYKMRGWSVAPTHRKVFSRTTGVSPSDILHFSFNGDGTLNDQDDSSYHGDYPNATNTFMSSDESLVIDTAGIVYQTSNLTYANSLGSSVSDLTFYEDLPIILSSGVLYSYSNTFLKTGSYSPTVILQKIFYDNGQVYGFYLSIEGSLDVSIIPVSSLTPTEPGQPISPEGLQYIPDEVFVGSDGVVYLLSKSHLSIFRWSLQQSKYLETIPLLLAPDHVAYSVETNRIYLAYSSGSINQIKLDESFIETPFVNPAQPATGLATAGQYIFVCDPSGSWQTHTTYDPDGSLLSQVDWNYFSREYVWNTNNQKIYFFRDDTSPNDLLWEEIGSDGILGTKKDSPYHSSEGIKHPIHVSPDGTVVLLGSGRVYDAISLTEINALSNDIVDADWTGGKLYSIITGQVDTKIQEWGQNYLLDEVVNVPGVANSIISHNGSLVLVTIRSGEPLIHYWDPSVPRINSDNDDFNDAFETCDEDPLKFEPGICGCGNPDIDSDMDGVYNCNDKCPNNPHKTKPDHLECSSLLGDINGDSIIGLEEAIHALQVLSGNRSRQ